MEAVRDFVSGKAVVLSDRDTVQTAAQAMRDRNIGSVLAYDQSGKLVGILTDRDIVCMVVAGAKDYEVPISSVMSREVQSINEDSTVEEAIELMERQGIRRVPVVRQLTGGGERCVGMISLNDLILAKKVSAESLRNIVQFQIFQTARRADRGRAERRKEHRLDLFIKTVSGEMGMERDGAESFILLTLKEMIRRITYTEAADFIAQLPENLQEDLWRVPAGPDKAVTAAHLVKALEAHSGLSEEDVRATLPRLWRGLEKALKQEAASGKGELAHVLSQFPEDLRQLFGFERMEPEIEQRSA